MGTFGFGRKETVSAKRGPIVGNDFTISTGGQMDEKPPKSGEKILLGRVYSYNCSVCYTC